MTFDRRDAPAPTCARTGVAEDGGVAETDAMRVRFLRLTTVTVAAAAGAAVAAVLWLAGSVVVIDETGGVRSAAVVNDIGAEQPLHRVWPRVFVTLPRLEGTIEIRCVDGARKRSGYVTAHVHTRLRVVGGACERLVDGG